jgi:hypothetical protein
MKSRIETFHFPSSFFLPSSCVPFSFLFLASHSTLSIVCLYVDSYERSNHASLRKSNNTNQATRLRLDPVVWIPYRRNSFAAFCRPASVWPILMHSMSKTRPVSWRANPLPLWKASLIGEVQLLVLTLLSHGFAARPFYVGLMVKRVSLGRIFVRILRFFSRHFHSTDGSDCFLYSSRRRVIFLIDNVVK